MVDQWQYRGISLQALVDLSRLAGERILEVYHQANPVDIQVKSDCSPVTAADLAAHACLAEGLVKLLDVPVLSEEGELPELLVRRQWTRYWLIDPLDGTREFITRNGEFTVNIALIENGVSVLGVVHVPVLDETYAGVNSVDASQSVARKYTAGANAQVIHSRSLAQRRVQQRPLKVLASHRHFDKDPSGITHLLEQQWPAGIDVKHAGSSLKFCLLAEGVADLYPRLGLTSEWDTAASQAVLEAAGGAILEAEPLHSGQWQPLRYNNKTDFLNPFFYAVGDASGEWRELLREK